MKTKLYLAAVASLAALLTNGCSSTNITKLVQAAAKDPANVKIKATTPWGTIEYERDNSAAALGMTNSILVSPAPGLLVIPQK